MNKNEFGFCLAFLGVGILMMVFGSYIAKTFGEVWSAPLIGGSCIIVLGTGWLLLEQVPFLKLNKEETK